MASHINVSKNALTALYNPIPIDIPILAFDVAPSRSLRGSVAGRYALKFSSRASIRARSAIISSWSSISTSNKQVKPYGQSSANHVSRKVSPVNALIVQFFENTRKRGHDDSRSDQKAHILGGNQQDRADDEADGRMLDVIKTRH